ncbi:tRNA (uridine(34)/cytosine(34)/5-carboxymethylaminomethyluridine(34)-2'-O)-methyltransferase TrmL [Bacillus sp. DNRA2]|uniref:tRNA (uridine(34)/cytosine(34)/5- carboxymethylaminomethyluridine(34)-2'-O)- methyltransferase TrmL n=1 Tax=Bacillus sp. DNRA2 TaxID=2723053 RepID=UPI00145FAEC1|nr:tRNA (uridine(34)/cytosine(34)/5-carboxymethylaminomethyluridine(34)-2'-O)-methyltransferase TrmL [Bacillus sp. DNRA2]NMD71699.1 tRNA (uridine(34)/cytosine(34)/5-carboxymethylaminomethyluridine(34)-2'-O)-methyltransferase TrmL [Bacillus sp. DNRA2]
MAIHVVLYQPDIPANTGNIALTCAATDTALHLIRPLGFSTDAEMLRKAGIDFWDSVNVTYYDSLDEFFSKNQGEFYYIETFGEKTHSAFDFSDVSKDHYFMFGKETTGLPMDLLENNKDHFLRIPMNDHVRSLNLSNTAAILVYEALRQQDFPNLK